ncbi:MAG: hypothetical protein KGQ60_09675, partial [Planctomycetes bacterium]|nr:hypothetical protein [Planctomycetota bacterium]
ATSRSDLEKRFIWLDRSFEENETILSPQRKRSLHMVVVRAHLSFQHSVAAANRNLGGFSSLRSSETESNHAS